MKTPDEIKEKKQAIAKIVCFKTTGLIDFRDCSWNVYRDGCYEAFSLGVEEGKKQVDRKGLDLVQYNDDFYGYTVFTILFNQVPVRFVTEKDANNVIEKIRKLQEGQQ